MRDSRQGKHGSCISVQQLPAGTMTWAWHSHAPSQLSCENSGPGQQPSLLPGNRALLTCCLKFVKRAGKERQICASRSSNTDLRQTRGSSANAWLLLVRTHRTRRQTHPQCNFHTAFCFLAVTPGILDKLSTQKSSLGFLAVSPGEAILLLPAPASQQERGPGSTHSHTAF